MPIELEVSSLATVALEAGSQSGVEWSESEYVPLVVTDLPDWAGPYEATPSEAEQVFDMTDHAMRSTFTVHPIPSNYGRVAWNGAVLTVS